MSQSSAIAATMEGELVIPKGAQKGEYCNLAKIKPFPTVEP